MRKMITTAAIILGIFVLAAPTAMAAEPKAVYNNYQWLRDADGDGIPNCDDPDYVPPQDGTGYGKLGKATDSAVSADQIRLQDQEQLRDGSCGEDGCALYQWLHKYFYNYFYNHNFNYKWGGQK